MGSSSNISFTSFSNIIDGKLRGSSETYHGINPTNEEPLWPVAAATAEDVEDAVSAASKAFRSWSRTSHAERCERVNAWAHKVLSMQKELSELSAKEGGKPVQAAGYELTLATNNAHAITTFSLEEEVIDDGEREIYTRHLPIGIAGLICPWNWPIMIAMNKISHCMVSGNCAIAKPS